MSSCSWVRHKFYAVPTVRLRKKYMKREFSNRTLVINLFLKVSNFQKQLLPMANNVYNVWTVSTRVNVYDKIIQYFVVVSC